MKKTMRIHTSLLSIEHGGRGSIRNHHSLQLLLISQSKLALLSRIGQTPCRTIYSYIILIRKGDFFILIYPTRKAIPSDARIICQEFLISEIHFSIVSPESKILERSLR